MNTRPSGPKATSVAPLKRLPVPAGWPPTSICSRVAPRRELADRRRRGVHRPDGARGVDADRVRELVETIAPGAKDAALRVEGDHGSGPVTALEHVRHALSVERHPRHHAQRPAGPRWLYEPFRLDQGQPACPVDDLTRVGARRLRLQGDLAARHGLDDIRFARRLVTTPLDAGLLWAD